MLFISTIALCREGLKFYWRDADIDGGLTCYHYHIWASKNGSPYYFVEYWSGPHLDGRSGPASAPYQFPDGTVYEPGDIMLIIVQAMHIDHAGEYIRGTPSAPIAPMDEDEIGKPSKAICTEEIES